MLQTVNLTKVYKTKKGVRVKALDNVNIKFPEKGMVFLLGKSGSGKSTLLNLLGGLDKSDGGDIIIKGVSTKSFKQEHFDSYRNTYVGFIFQEYNILDEFSVGANIALALQLQGKKPTDELINDILCQVDLDGYGNRKPNELSGGQKQRVAIARALVKNPEIIMADEPTGALDSSTGTQVLDTLKKLSKDKLVIVVSHDREFAEKYADRIIELSDGRVINDEQLCDESQTDASVPTAELSFEGRTVHVAQNYHLTEQDVEKINAFIDRLARSEQPAGADIEISAAQKTRVRKPTDQSKIIYADTSKFNLIKSRLPMKSAFKIGANGLKYKKIRLVVTILLSCIAFGLFGMADTLGSYDHVNVCANSILDSDINYASFSKAFRRDTGIEGEWYYNSGYPLSEQDLEQITENCGISVEGVYRPVGADLGFTYAYDNSVEFTQTEYNIYADYFNGFAEVDPEGDDSAHKLYAGRWPKGDADEIAISKYICRTFMKGGYRSADGSSFEKISDYADMVGKTLVLDGKEYLITGIFDTGMDIQRFESLTEYKEYMTAAEQAVQMFLFSELSALRSYSLDCVALVGEGFIDRMIDQSEPIYSLNLGHLYFYNDDYTVSFSADYISYVSEYPLDNVIWAGQAQKTLGENELIVSTDILDMLSSQLGLDTSDGYGNMLSELNEFMANGYGPDDELQLPSETYKIVGYIDPAKSDTTNLVVAPDSLAMQFTETDSKYVYAVGSMPEDLNEVKKIAEYCYREEDIRYSLENSVTHELDSVSEIISMVAKWALYVGIAFALFAALMLANFISTSISYKKQEIGILRAIGSRSNDVFRIFFSESFIIAMINFVLSAIGVGVVTYLINYAIRVNTGILITILSFGIRQVALLFVISIAIAAAASFIPVKKIASKRPIDAIRDR